MITIVLHQAVASELRRQADHARLASLASRRVDRDRARGARRGALRRVVPATAVR